jgi:(p)ppGpp synthase/HD superfamily hydrolase
MSLILLAATLADAAHEGQKRKWTGRDYIEHPMRVAGRVSLLDDVTEEEVAAAWLHDVIEDCPLGYAQIIRSQYPNRVVQLVEELTNPSKKRPEIDRKSRKALDRAHFVHVGRWAKLIKLIDRIDNLRDMDGADSGFKSLYLQESLLLANVLFDYTDPENKRLYLELMTEIAAQTL